MQTKESKKYHTTFEQKIETEKAIDKVKKTFSNLLTTNLNLNEVVAPLVVLENSGINDELSGVERPVTFPIKDIEDKKGVVVQSLAKWKRLRLAQLSAKAGSGILTDMKALRPDDDLSPMHSVYVDQWDWEKVMLPEQRTFEYLKSTVINIYEALLLTEHKICSHYHSMEKVLPPKITFIHAEDLMRAYPHLSPKERENKATEKYKAIFLIGIGGKLSNGKPHDGRAPDYDDWATETDDGYFGLNGDIIVWNPVLKCAFELSSMGIRVDPKTLWKQLKLHNCVEKKDLFYHKLLLDGQLPQTIGGGIGQSRMCMFMLRKEHIGEVQASVWPDEVYKSTREKGINII